MNPTVLGLPNEVQELCPDIPELDLLLKEIGDLAESGARYTEMPHVIEITLPMLCNYLPRWWERGLENFPDLEGRICTDVTAEHLNQLLGSIMKIVVNNLGIDEASWMKRLAGEHHFKCYNYSPRRARVCLMNQIWFHKVHVAPFTTNMFVQDHITTTHQQHF